MDFTIPYENEIDEKDKTIIQEYILNNIKDYENNSTKLTELIIEAVSSLSAGKSRTEYLAKQGFWQNIFNSITGQNRKIRGEIDYNYAIVKNASLKMIEYLANQNKITYEGLIYLNNKLNNIEKNIEEELIAICNNVRESFNVILNKINKESNRIDSLEKKVQLLEFKAASNILEFDNIKYIDMDNIEKIICLSNDLFTKISNVNNSDNNIPKENIYMIKSILFDFNVDMNQKIKVNDIYCKLIEKPNFINKIFLNTQSSIKTYEYIIPILSGIKKIEKLDKEESYIINSIIKINPQINIKDIKIDLINEYGMNISNFDYNAEITNYDIIILIINELKMISKNLNAPIKYSDSKKSIELAREYFEQKKYKKAMTECDSILSKDKNNKEARHIKIESLYKILIKEVRNFEAPLCYKEIAKIYLIKRDYENTLKYLNKYFDSYSSNKEIFKYKEKLQFQYKKIKEYEDKTNKKLEKITDKNKRDYLEFINDFWGVYLSKI
ncbi:hypothetical protein OFQ54_00790 [Brachyspira hyodysenteriae]|uniref:tetratricopeptide repeat protein n=1 Tax=Brachyspira hyodysenteriae TaxID=159 RepID=UPI000A268CD6|nr:hypothetical protein [Brachyspira hyodysenteriae]MCZ9960377.1 hypothetical protein [Brachyspira hyodysenteriae]